VNYQRFGISNPSLATRQRRPSQKAVFSFLAPPRHRRIKNERENPIAFNPETCYAERETDPNKTEVAMGDQFIVLDTVSGRMEAEWLRSYLQAQRIPCEISQEAIGWVDGITVSPLGQVRILVPARHSKQARAALKDYRKTQQKV
jgi:hypothetical protein